MLEIIINTLFSIGLTLGVGSSTFALILYISALEDGSIDASERRFLHIVFVVLRIGMALIFVTLLAKLALFYPTFGLQEWVQLVLLVIITGNAALMHLHLMPMKYGPILAGGSWYTLFFVSILPPYHFSPISYLGIFLSVLVVTFVVFNYCKRRFTTTTQS